MPATESLQERVDALRVQAQDLRQRVDSDSLRARLDDALIELERIPNLFTEAVARHALLVPAGRIRTVRDILGWPHP